MIAVHAVLTSKIKRKKELIFHCHYLLFFSFTSNTLQRFFQSLISHCVLVKWSLRLLMCLIWKTVIRQTSTNSAQCSFTTDVLDSQQLSLLSQFDFGESFFRSCTKAKWALTTLSEDLISFSSVRVISSIISQISQRKFLLWFPLYMGQTLLLLYLRPVNGAEHMWVTQAYSKCVIQQENRNQECCEQTPEILILSQKPIVPC